MNKVTAKRQKRRTEEANREKRFFFFLKDRGEGKFIKRRVVKKGGDGT